MLMRSTLQGLLFAAVMLLGFGGIAEAGTFNPCTDREEGRDNRVGSTGGPAKSAVDSAVANSTLANSFMWVRVRCYISSGIKGYYPTKNYYKVVSQWKNPRRPENDADPTNDGNIPGNGVNREPLGHLVITDGKGSTAEINYFLPDYNVANSFDDGASDPLRYQKLTVSELRSGAELLVNGRRVFGPGFNNPADPYRVMIHKPTKCRLATYQNNSDAPQDYPYTDPAVTSQQLMVMGYKRTNDPDGQRSPSGLDYGHYLAMLPIASVHRVMAEAARPAPTFLAYLYRDINYDRSEALRLCKGGGCSGLSSETGAGEEITKWQGGTDQWGDGYHQVERMSEIGRLDGGNWNDEVSSLKVLIGHMNFYQHAAFGGSIWTMPGGSHRPRVSVAKSGRTTAADTAVAMKNDSMSSFAMILPSMTFCGSITNPYADW